MPKNKRVIPYISRAGAFFVDILDKLIYTVKQLNKLFIFRNADYYNLSKGAATMGTKRRIKRSAGSDLVPLQTAFEEFIVEKQAHNLSADTLRNYNLSYNLFYEFHNFTEDTTTDEISQSHFYKWINTMKLEGVKPVSINSYLRNMRVFLNWCMDADRKYIDPPFKIEMLEKQEEPPKHFTDEEISALLERPRRNDSFAVWRTWAIVNWVLGTGNRAATICEVRLCDINYAKREITLAHTKNKKAQIIPLSTSLETVLKEYVRMWRKEAEVNGFLFCDVGENQLTTNALRLSFGRYCASRGVEKTNIHGLRHSFARGWIQNNGNTFALQKMLGHSTLDMTRRYVRLYGEDIKEDFDKFNPLDNIKKASRRTKSVKRT